MNDKLYITKNWRVTFNF